MAKTVVFFDTEIGIDDKKVHDIGAIRSSDNASIHSASVRDFKSFIEDAEFVCGHNIVNHDLKYIGPVVDGIGDKDPIDTLYLSPLVFPRRPYHALLKDDKLQVEELNNPLNDSQKAMDLFYDEVNAFNSLSAEMQQILCCLLYCFPEFQGFFKYIDFLPRTSNVIGLIKEEFKGKLCENADIEPLIKQYPIELAYALTWIGIDDYQSLTPPWLLKNFPKIENVIKYLRGTPCSDKCAFCREAFDVHKGLKRIFGFDTFRKYNGEPLQEKAAEAAVDGKSVLAVFPTGGGKSITFQLPALMAGNAFAGLTVVISPLQSLMKDQVDNLTDAGICGAVTINGLLSPVERASAIDQVMNGTATLLYISPESLRSKTIEKMLMSRNIARFVIDEAHCFSAWGQDFRVDYLYIGKFIRELQEKKLYKKPIPVSCFTATAKQKVITDICAYFEKELGIYFDIYASSAARENLHYTVLHKETDEEKYDALRNLVSQKDCATIIYVSRTRRTTELAEKLTSDGFRALPFNGKMDADEKIANQDAFMNNEVKIIVATSAFGMGVDKKDVKLVIHYDISDSLENYVQEAGRAGRDPSLQAECYVLFNDNDLDKHFLLLNQTKLSMSEIQQVWKAIKELTRERPRVTRSALEIARQAGWDESVYDVEMRVKTAIAALENAGYLERGKNMPKVFATSILVKNMAEASARIQASTLFPDEQSKAIASRIFSNLMTKRSVSMNSANDEEAESRVDYIADHLGLTKEIVIHYVNLMREEGLLDNFNDMDAFIMRSDTQNKSAQTLDRFAKLELFILEHIDNGVTSFNLKELNEAALNEGISFSSVKRIKTILYYLYIKGYVQTERTGKENITVAPSMEIDKVMDKYHKRIDICRFIVETLYNQARTFGNSSKDEIRVEFSLVGLYNAYKEAPRLTPVEVVQGDIEDALLYLSKIDAMRLEGGFLVLYSGLDIKRLITDNKIRYKVDDYRVMDEFYKQRIQQIHIVGEYAKLMVRDYDAALKFVQDYFNMDYKKFISSYFEGERLAEIERNITPEKYHKLFDELSEKQLEIVNDADSKYIVVAAGPGSGKTRVLVHKLASLLLLEDVKHEQLLMVTFSRAAATEFKQRLMELIGNAASFVEIKTFHSYCFDLLGKIGSLDGVENVVRDAAEMINSGEVEPGRIAKSVLVIDEAQDMDEHEFALVKALMEQNDDMRVIAVGDDDQNIYEFRGSNSKYLRSFIDDCGAKLYEMEENYRSKRNIVAFANEFVRGIDNRMKSRPIESFSKENGTVKLIHYTANNLEEPVVNNLITTYSGQRSCVLTETNEQALRIVGLLNKKGIRAKLIQSNDDFRLSNLAEVRYILKMINRDSNTPKIDEKLWRDVKNQLMTVYRDSECLENCLNMLVAFESVNRVKYRTDLEEFIKESHYEDFYSQEQGTVFVSTIHKSKGREFDNVYMMLDNVNATTDEEKRKLYVGMTRAKSALYIHYNNNLFNNISGAFVERAEDNTCYPEPEEITLQLTHRDVVLDFFKGKKETVLKIHSGAELAIDGGYLSANVGGKLVRVVKLSTAFLEQLERLKQNGYYPNSAKVHFIVAWKSETDTEESAVVLPSITLKNS